MNATPPVVTPPIDSTPKQKPATVKEVSCCICFWGATSLLVLFAGLSIAYQAVHDANYEEHTGNVVEEADVTGVLYSYDHDGDRYVYHCKSCTDADGGYKTIYHHVDDTPENMEKTTHKITEEQTLANRFAFATLGMVLLAIFSVPIRLLTLQYC